MKNWLDKKKMCRSFSLMPKLPFVWHSWIQQTIVVTLHLKYKIISSKEYIYIYIYINRNDEIITKSLTSLSSSLTNSSSCVRFRYWMELERMKFLLNITPHTKNWCGLITIRITTIKWFYMWTYLKSFYLKFSSHSNHWVSWK